MLGSNSSRNLEIFSPSWPSSSSGEQLLGHTKIRPDFKRCGQILKNLAMFWSALDKFDPIPINLVGYKIKNVFHLSSCLTPKNPVGDMYKSSWTLKVQTSKNLAEHEVFEK